MPESAITKAIKRLAKAHGEDVVVSMSSPKSFSKLRGGVSTQSLCIDMAIGRPGLPGGRLTQVVGLEGEGKSTLLTHVIAEAQRRGGAGILADTEFAYDAERAAKLGVDTENLILLQPESMEQLFELCEESIQALVEQNISPIVLGVDTFSSKSTEAEDAGEYSDEKPGTHARVIGKGIRKLLPLIARHNVVFVAVSQLREKLGTVVWHGQKQYSTLGGLAIPYHSSLRLNVKRKEVERVGSGESKEAKGIWVTVTCIKNKVGSPFKQARCYVDFEKGYSRQRDLFRAALKVGVIEKSGNGRLSIHGKPMTLEQWPMVMKKIGPGKLVAEVRRAAIKQGIIKPWDAT